MTDAQETVLYTVALGAMTAEGIARRIGSRPQHVVRSLDALYRRSLVTVTDGNLWMITNRGRKKISEGSTSSA